MRDHRDVDEEGEGTKETERLIPLERVLSAKEKTRPLDEDIIGELAASIKARGLKQPILVRPNGDYFYRVVFGEHRLEACKRAGLKEIRAFVEAMDDDEELVLKVTENAHRNTFVDPVVEGGIFVRLLKKYRTVNGLAEALGKRTQYVQDRVNVYYQLEPTVKKMIGKGITVTNAIAISKMPDHWKQIELAKQIVAAKEHSTRAGGAWGGYGYAKPVRVSLYHKCGQLPWCGKVHRIKGGPEVLVDAEES